MAKDNIPYVVPVSFGYDGKAIYFHSAQQGQKIDFITANNRVCFEFEGEVRLLANESSPCNWTFSFQSVIGNGRVVELIDVQERTRALECIVKQYASSAAPFETSRVSAVRVWKIEIESMTGKQSKDILALSLEVSDSDPIS